MQAKKWLSIPCLLAPCLLASAVFAQAASASDLVPPAGYYAPVHSPAKKPRSCDAPPTPYTGSLVFRSKYEGSDKARSTLNKKAEKAFRDSTADITTMERGSNRYVMRYMQTGDPKQLECAIQWMDSWAQAGALLSTDYNHTGKSMRKWALGSMSSAYLRLKFSESQPLKAYPEQAQEIEQWFVKLAELTVKDWSNLPQRKINNHSYWAAWSVMATAVATNHRDLFDWSIKEFQVAANQVDADGYLPNELKRKQRALAYHNYSLPPLTMIAAFAEANGVDLRPANQQALKRLAERVMDGVSDPDEFKAKTGDKQDMTDLKKPAKFSWLAPYCTLYSCTADFNKGIEKFGPFKTFRLGGDVSSVFNPKSQGG
ncbi:mannuronate-specific alginate lyase [Pseudomonas sp. EL_65y_Pfl2_R95]|uniref:mannuronate-specific alginate lyase n=1 Tax=Pseudomonas sp. EL_65y_Pfl2_R95 TaxID=3088698 RepID=UPI0030DBABF8